MRLLVLGSGGNTPIPTPTCACTVCEQARTAGPPYSRGGNSLYLPDIAAMVDAPEFAFRALNRERVQNLDYIFLTHWHPDHINGLRLVQSRDMTAHDGLLDAVAAGGPTLVTTETVYERVRDIFGQVEHFTDMGFADLRFIDDDPLEIGPATIHSIPCALEDEDLDFLADELTHQEVLARIDRLGYDRVLLTEIEHLTARSHDDFAALADGDTYDSITFAYDGLEIEL